MTHSLVTIQITPESVPSISAFLGEVVSGASTANGASVIQRTSDGVPINRGNSLLSRWVER